MASAQSMSVTQNQLLQLNDHHCHLSVHASAESCQMLDHTLKAAGFGKRFFHLMSTNHIDLELVEILAYNQCIAPYFGIHPWYSHLFTDLDTTDANADSDTLKKRHYNSVLVPEPTPELLDNLPVPLSLHQYLVKIKSYCNTHGFSGIGELGLDRLFRVPSNGYYGNGNHVTNDHVTLSRCKVTLEHQIKVFRHQLAVAEELQVPVSVHCVKAHGALFEIVKSYPTIPRIVLHSYSGSIDHAKVWIKHYKPLHQRLQFSLSYYINGSPGKQSHLQEMLALLDDDEILLETDLGLDQHIDTDYMDHLKGIFDKVLESRKWDFEKLHHVLYHNQVVKNTNIHSTT